MGCNITYEQFYNKMLDFARQGMNGYVETVQYYELERAQWHSEDEFLYPEVKKCLKHLSAKYKIGIIANQQLGTQERLEKMGIAKYISLVISSADEGISVSRVAADQRNNGTYVSRDNLQPGDLVFFGKGGNIHHVGIYVGNGNMIHAPQTGDVVKISSINTEYRISQYAGAVRVY